MGFDLVAEDEVGAGIASASGGELVAERGQGLGAPGRGERVEPDDELAVAGDDVAGDGERFADEGVGLVASAGVVPVQRPGQGVSALKAAIRMAWVICLTSVSSRIMSGAISPRRMRAGTAAAASSAASSSR